MALAELATLLVGVLTLAWIVRNYLKSRNDPLKGLPGPFALPFIGNVLSIALFHENSGKMSLYYDTKYGKTYRFNLLGQDSCILGDPHDIAKCAKSTTRFYKLTSTGDGPIETKYGIPCPVLFDLKGDEWKRRRIYVQRAFDQRHTKALVENMSALSLRFAQRLRTEYCRGGGPQQFDMMSELRRMMMTAMNRTILGSSESLLEGGGCEVAEAIEYAIKRNAMDALVPDWVPGWVLNDKKLARCVDCFQGMIAKQLERCEKLTNEELEAQGHIAALLVLAGRDEAAIKLSEEQLKGELYQYCVAGFDTSKCTLGVLFYHLAQHPDVQSKLREEIRQHCPGGKIPSMEQLNELKYLSAVVDESQRVQPIVPIVDRILEEPTTISEGRTLPAGTVVFLGLQPVQVDPQVWGADSHEFVPERHLKQQAETQQCPRRLGLVQFGAGPKRCVGFQLASMQVRVITAAIVSAFDIRCARKNQALKLVDSIVLEPKGLDMVVSPVDG